MTHRSISPPTSLALAAVTILLSCFLAIGCGNKPDNDPDSGVTNPCANVTCTEPGEVCQNGQCVNPNKGGACNGVTCEGDAQCSEGKCLCGTTECESGKICQSGSCVDKPTACDNVTCEGDAVCSNGTCLCNGNACSDNQVCRGNVCLDKCGSTECPSGEGCYKDKCVSKCDTACVDAGEKCVDNLCIDLCEGVTCNGTTEQCIDGTCVPQVANSCKDWNAATEITLGTGDIINVSEVLDFSSVTELDASTNPPLTGCDHGLIYRPNPKETFTGAYKRLVLKFELTHPSTARIDFMYPYSAPTDAGLFVKLFKGCDNTKTVEACAFSIDTWAASLTRGDSLPAGTYYIIVESTQLTENNVEFSFTGQKIKADIAGSTCSLNRMSCDADKVLDCRLPTAPETDPMVKTERACLPNQCEQFTPYFATCRGEHCWAPIEIDGTTAGVHDYKGGIVSDNFRGYYGPDDASCDLSKVDGDPRTFFYHVSNLKKDQEVIFNPRVNPTTDTGMYDILFKSTCDESSACHSAQHETASDSKVHKYVATKDGDSIYIIVVRSVDSSLSPSGPQSFEHQIDVKAAP